MSDTDSEFFMSIEAESAKVGRALQRAVALKTRLFALNQELSERAASWLRLAGANSSDLGETVFETGDTGLDILRPYPPSRHAPPNRPELNCVATLPREHFDGEGLWKLISDRESTKQQLSSLRKELAALGVTV